MTPSDRAAKRIIGGEMKTWMLLVSSNAGEYYGKVIITANNIEVGWSNEKAKERDAFWAQDHDGDTVIVDGVQIEFDEGFMFRGELKQEASGDE